ncbi:hypothetical protein [Belliella buryatensis]|nr:hypothetical protein [Belliella buryatensis]
MKFPNVKEIKTLEASMKGVLEGSAELILNFNPLEKDGKSRKTKGEIYKRPTSSFPLDLHVWYLFDQKAKPASVIIYNWGLYNPSFNANENVELLRELNKKEVEFVAHFNSLYQDFVQKHGDPLPTDTDIDEPHILLKSCFWEKEDRFIKLKLEFTRKLNDFPGIGYQTNNFKIEVVVSSKAEI